MLRVYCKDSTSSIPLTVFFRHNFRLNSSIEKIELSFDSVGGDDNLSLDRFWSWIDLIRSSPANLKKLVFAAHSLYIAKKKTVSGVQTLILNI